MMHAKNYHHERVRRLGGFLTLRVAQNNRDIVFSLKFNRDSGLMTMILIRNRVRKMLELLLHEGKNLLLGTHNPQRS